MMMSEDKVPYTTQPNELTQLRRQNRELSEKLDRQIAAWNANGDALTAHAAQQAARIAELEQEVTGIRLSAAVMKGAYIEASDKATALEAQVQRLEADNRRLRHLDSMPVDATRRQFLNSSYVDAIDTGTYDPTQADEDMQVVGNWLFPNDGAA